MPAAYDEWRLVTKLLARVELLEEIVSELWSATPEDVDVHSRGANEIMTYAYSEEEIRVAEVELQVILDREAVPTESTLTRWNPDAERWQDPALPVGPPPYRIEPEWTELGELGWEVRIKTKSWYDGRRLETRLRKDARPVVSDGMKRLTIGVADEEAAELLTAELRSAGEISEIYGRPLTRFRRWLIRQALLGNYGESPLDGR